ncbi:MAG: EAL domain-containing protein [Deltaproteobacteria bacterium]|nr:EAL domain-containing protein [Deltaproteobacteria bacterium]
MMGVGRGATMDLVSREVFAPGATIFREGEPGEQAYVIESGAVEITALKDGKSVLLSTLRSGDLLGEMALIDRKPRTATARAVERTELVIIRRDYFEERLEQADPLLNLLLRVVLERFRHTRRSWLRGDDPNVPQSGPPADTYSEARTLAISDLKLQLDLENALERGELVLHFQPIVELGDKRTVGYEALLRWQHPQRGLVPPAEFIGFAEETGVIVPIGLWAMQAAHGALRRFRDAAGRAGRGQMPLFVSVNLSARQLTDPAGLDRLCAALAGDEVEAHSVTLEITESLLMREPEQAARSLERLRRLGVGLAIDDFGTGYSSLSYLHRFPLDTLKIDRSFIAAMLQDAGTMKIVRAICGLSHELGLGIVAEGVETPAQLERLRELGCHRAQGYLFARPRPEEEICAALGR